MEPDVVVVLCVRFFARTHSDIRALFEQAQDQEVLINLADE